MPDGVILRMLDQDDATDPPGLLHLYQVGTHRRDESCLHAAGGDEDDDGVAAGCDEDVDGDEDEDGDDDGVASGGDEEDDEGDAGESIQTPQVSQLLRIRFTHSFPQVVAAAAKKKAGTSNKTTAGVVVAAAAAKKKTASSSKNTPVVAAAAKATARPAQVRTRANAKT